MKQFPGTTQSAPLAGRGRDVRIDAFRGLALAMIFVNHTPGNWLSGLTLRQFGFSDAAELFVLISGFTCAAVFGRAFDREGWRAGGLRVAKRVRTLYLRHVALILGLAGVVVLAARWLENPAYFEMFNLAPLASDTLGALGQMLLLSYQLPYLNILPLYIVLLAMFPLMYALLRVGRWAALAASAALYVAAHVFGWNLVEYPGGNGWFFNPFAWQLLFTIGAAVGLDRPLPRFSARAHLVLSGMAGTYLAVGILVAAPWTALPGLEASRLVDWNQVPPMSKSLLSPWRLAHILAFVYLAVRLVPDSVYRSLAGRAAVLLGKHSLDIFCLGTVLSFLGMFIFVELGRDWPTQLAVNLGGMAMMIIYAKRAERRKTASRKPAENAATRAMSVPASR
ncbi:MAG: OpgC family protein [Alphaproteobacteria bacterium]